MGRLVAISDHSCEAPQICRSVEHSFSGYGLNMEASQERRGSDRPVPDYRTLPPGVRLDETIASVDADSHPDPAAGRNLDQHRALRDD